MNQANPSSVESLRDRTALRADAALHRGHAMADDAMASLRSGVDEVRRVVPATLGRAAAQVEDLTRRGVARARDLSADVRDRAVRAGDRTVGYIQDEPVKAVLIAVATGAAVALLVRALSGRRRY